MEQYRGKSIYKGIAIGPVRFFEKEQINIKRVKCEDTSAEIERFYQAKKKTEEQLQKLYEKALNEVGEVNAAIFEVHQMMLDDDDYKDSIENIITSQKVNAEYAVANTSDNFSKMFSEMEDEYFKARAIDVKDISERLIRNLAGGVEKDIEDVSSIIVAKDLAPSETVQMDKSRLLAFVTELGSANSHTAILARTMGIPALTGIQISKEWNGKTAVVDGYEGILYIDPDEETLFAMEKRKKEDEDQKALLLQLKGKETKTKSGHKINLYSNIGNVGDVAAVLNNDAEGIGLFRSEFLYLEKDHDPTEDEQFHAYKSVAEMMAGKKVIIRTLDIGADKQVDYFHLDKEENPAMGFRAIRICLEREEIFKTQLKALFRASMYGQVAIMYPMITSLWEVKRIKEIAAEVKAELDQMGIPYKDVEQGIMIETPAAVMVSEELAKEVDFFSIGTNDLTQYTLAIDRQNQKLDRFYDPHHPAILRMIQMVIDNGHKHDCWVGICGELGADIGLTKKFVEMGIDELSVAAGAVLQIRKLIREME